MVSEKDKQRTLAMMERIEQKRLEAGISKAELFERCKITQGAFSQWKTGRTMPLIKSIRAIAQALNTTEEYLLYGQEEKPAFDSGLSNAQKELLSIIPFLSEQEATVLLATARAQASVRKAPGGQG